MIANNMANFSACRQVSLWATYWIDVCLSNWKAEITLCSDKSSTVRFKHWVGEDLWKVCVSQLKRNLKFTFHFHRSMSTLWHMKETNSRRRYSKLNKLNIWESSLKLYKLVNPLRNSAHLLFPIVSSSVSLQSNSFWLCIGHFTVNENHRNH